MPLDTAVSPQGELGAQGSVELGWEKLEWDTGTHGWVLTNWRGSSLAPFSQYHFPLRPGEHTKQHVLHLQMASIVLFLLGMSGSTTCSPVQ